MGRSRTLRLQRVDTGRSSNAADRMNASQMQRELAESALSVGTQCKFSLIGAGTPRTIKRPFYDVDDLRNYFLRNVRKARQWESDQRQADQRRK